MSKAEIAREKLFSNLRALMEDVEELLKATAEQSGDGMSSLRERILQTLESGKGTLAQGKRILNTSKQGAEAAMTYAHENPWATLGIVMGAGVALACLLWGRSAR